MRASKVKADLFYLPIMLERRRREESITPLKPWYLWSKKKVAMPQTDEAKIRAEALA